MLEKLLKKSKSTRERYAFWGAISITGVIGLVWFMTVTISFQDGGPFAVDESQQTASAFSQFFGELKDDFLNSKLAPNKDNRPANQEEESKSSATENEPVKADEEPAVTVATSSARSVQVGTSSSQSR